MKILAVMSMEIDPNPNCSYKGMRSKEIFDQTAKGQFIEKHEIV